MISASLTKASKKGLLLSAGALFAVVLTGAPARAGFAQQQASPPSGETSRLVTRMSEIENQIQTLSRAVFKGEKMPAVTTPVQQDSRVIAGYEDRLAQIEKRQRELTGQIEQASHQAQDALNRLEKLQADYDARLQKLEQAAAAAPAAPPEEGLNPSEAKAEPAPEKPEIETDDQTLGEISSSTQTPDALYEAAFADVKESRFDTAEKKFTAFLDKNPSHKLAGNAKYWLGETHYVRGDFKEAAKVFARAYQDHPKGGKAADSLLKMALSLSRLDKKDDACLSLQQLRKEFPAETTPASRRAVREMKRLSCAE